MNRAFVIALNDLRIFLKNKAGYFWLFGSPLMFAFFMGMAMRGPGDPSNPRPALSIENLDPGFMGKVFIEELGVQGLRVEEKTNNTARGVRIPVDFTTNILAKKPVKVEMFQLKDSGDESAAMVELRVVRAVLALNGHLVEQAESPGTPTEQRLRDVLKKANPVSLKASFATRKPIPAGYRQSVPGILVMFTMMNLLIFGGATVASERREGVLRRLLAQPLSFRSLVSGKILGLMLLGAVQMAFLLTTGILFMNLNVAGNLLSIILVMVIYSWVAASLGVFIGSVVSREDKVVAICVLVSMVMAALGGCWWPLEIVPEKVRLVGQLFPSAWAMEALHQLISFGGGLTDIVKPLVVITGYAIAASLAAIKFFRV
jgi:ABC-2 type transport system permease protein